MSKSRAVLAAWDETLSAGRIESDTWAECGRQLKDQKACVELVAAISA